ncbi:CAP-Gly domain-containing linker protein 3 [Nymphon striatum]|nr:CAP-Gly domain-containing linker protein 3 [Nymphon striatum]
MTADDVTHSGTGGISGSPVVHNSSDAPICESCKQLDLSFFDPSCPGCQEILRSPSTTIPQLFAILRQWVPQTQQNIDVIINEILSRGASVNDRDRMTDMTLLHYACKSGASGVGDVKTATRVVEMLLEKGADVSLRCNWTNMSALHYAAYFNVAPVIDLLLVASNGTDKDSTCHDFENGTALHIAASNLCLDAVNTLLKHGCNAKIRDDIGRNALECISNAEIYELIPDITILISKLKSVLEEVTPTSPNSTLSRSPSVTGGKAVLKSMGLSLGDDVLVNVGSHVHKVGKMRYCGKTSFAPGIWVGVELNDISGRNDGTVDGVAYFKCPQNQGIFVTISRISKYSNRSRSPRRSSPIRNVNHPKVNISRVTSKIETGLGSLRIKGDINLAIGDRVLTGRKKGTLRFSGQTHFAPGWWYGIELDEAVGKNDGSVNYIQTFCVFRLTESKECLCDKELVSLFSPTSSNSPTIGSPTVSQCLNFVDIEVTLSSLEFF